MKKIYYVSMCIILLLFIFITIQPLPFIGEDFGILPGGAYVGSLSNFFPIIFGLETATSGIGTGQLYYVFYTFYSLLGGSVRWHYNLINICLLAVNYFLLWQWFRKTEESEQKYLPWAFAAILFFTFSIPVWQINAAASGAPGVTQNIVTIVPLFIYFFYYRKKLSWLKQAFFFVVILFFTRISVITKGEGRLIFFIIFFYLFIITCYKSVRYIKAKKETPHLKELPLFEVKNILLLAALFVICIPIITLLIAGSGSYATKQSISKTDILYEYLPILYSLRPTELGQGFIHADYGFYYQLFLKMLYPWRVYSFLAVVTIIMSLGVWYLSIKKSKEASKNHEIVHLTLFSGIWFIMTLSAIEIQRGLTGVHYYYNWQIIDLYYAMFSGSIFVISCVWLAYTCISSLEKQKFYRMVLIFLLVALLIVKITTMLMWSSGFSDYFVGFFHAADAVKDYESPFNIVFHQGPMYIYSDSTILHYHFPAITSIEEDCPKEKEINTLLQQHLNASEIENITIFILSNDRLEACEGITEVMSLSPRSDSLYYFIKNLFGLSKQTYIYKA